MNADAPAPEIRIYRSRKKGLMLILLTSLFAVPCVYFMAHGDDSKTLWIGLGFGLLGYPVALMLLLDRRPRMILREEGIYSKPVGPAPIKWETIDATSTARVQQETFICLELNTPYESGKKKGRLGKYMSALNEQMGFGDISLHTGELDARHEKLLALIMQLIQADPTERKEILDSYRKGDLK